MQLPLTLRLKASALLAAALVAAHVLAFLGLAMTGIALMLKILSGALLLFSLAMYLRRHVLRRQVLALTLRPDGHMDIERPEGVITDLQVHPLTTVFPWLVVLLLREGSELIAVTLLPDSVDAEDFRQLRLWLRWKAVTQQELGA